MRKTLALTRRIPLSGLAFLIAVGVLLPVLIRQIGQMDLTDLSVAFRQIGAVNWVLAIAATVGSFYAIGKYDRVIHRLMQTSVPAPKAGAAGMRAIAVSQFLGMSVFSGALVRWRCLPDLGLWTATRLSAMVGVSFLMAWAVLTAIVAYWAPRVIVGDIGALGPAVILLALLATVYALRDRFPAKWRIWIEPWFFGSLLFWVALDTCLAALAFWVFLPADAQIGFVSVYFVYFVALGAGLVSNAPGGVGAFELTLFALLPKMDHADLLSALIAFRVVYYALPATIATLTLVKSPKPTGTPMLECATHDLHLAKRLNTYALINQGARILAGRGRNGAQLVRFQGPFLVAIGDPAGDIRHHHLDDHATDRGLWALCYKASARQAIQARAAGWRGIVTGQEAIFDPLTWSAQGPEFRQLRRKLRHAERSGIKIRELSNRLSFDELKPVADDWCRHSGRERGFSMGRFDPALLKEQRVFAAFVGQTPIAFVSFHAAPQGWTLDLLRYRQDVPDGCMHALIERALTTARAEGNRRLSLDCVAGFAGPLARLNHFDRGLYRFKQSFGPVWQPRYTFAPNWWQLALGLLVLAWGIHFPARLSPADTGKGIQVSV